MHIHITLAVIFAPHYTYTRGTKRGSITTEEADAHITFGQTVQMFATTFLNI